MLLSQIESRFIQHESSPNTYVTPNMSIHHSMNILTCPATTGSQSLRQSLGEKPGGQRGRYPEGIRVGRNDHCVMVFSPFFQCKLLTLLIGNPFLQLRSWWIYAPNFEVLTTNLWFFCEAMQSKELKGTSVVLYGMV